MGMGVGAMEPTKRVRETVTRPTSSLALSSLVVQLASRPTATTVRGLSTLWRRLKARAQSHLAEGIKPARTPVRSRKLSRLTFGAGAGREEGPSASLATTEPPLPPTGAASLMKAASEDDWQ